MVFTVHQDVLSLIDEVETVWIPLRDGRRLAARLFLPRSARGTPAPVILEYIPYRRRDGTRQGDEAMHRWFVSNGFACARVDIAGMGDSDGLVEDEYVQREQDDGLEVIDWLSRQPDRSAHRDGRPRCSGGTRGMLLHPTRHCVRCCLD
jgi:uncharacterized protein